MGATIGVGMHGLSQGDWHGSKHGSCIVGTCIGIIGAGIGATIGPGIGIAGAHGAHGFIKP